MQTQHIVTALLSMHKQADERIIDPEKIKSLLSKKLHPAVSNPEQIIKNLNDHIDLQVQKAEAFIIKTKERQNKIKALEQRQLKSRSLLEQKLKLKLQKSSKKKQTQQKQKQQSRTLARKLKEEFFTTRKQQITESEFRKRLQKFKAIKAENQSNVKNQSYQSLTEQRSKSLLGRSSSMRSSLEVAIQKKKELEQIQYFKTLQALEKKRIFEKPQKIISIPQTVDKSKYIEKLKSEIENRSIQKLGQNLWKIQQARLKKQKSINEKIKKMRNESQFKEQQRGYKIQTLKQEINSKIKAHREVLNKKNERFLTMRNKSTPHLQRNYSNISENRDSFDISGGQKRFVGSKNNRLSKTLLNNKLSKTLTNFGGLIKNQSSNHLQPIEFYEKEKENKMKKQIMSQLDQILKREKIGKLTTK